MASNNEKISEIRLRLRRNVKPGDLSNLIDEIRSLGSSGSVLLPDLIERIDKGGYPASLSIVPVIILHKSTALLEASMKRWDSTGPGMSVHEKAALFRAGFTRFQPELLDYLRDGFDRDDDPARSSIIEAFAESGTAGLTQDLEDIESWCVRRLKDLKQTNPESPKHEQYIRSLEAESREQFLAKLRQGIERIRHRPDLPPIDEQDVRGDVEEGREAEQAQNTPEKATATNSPSEWAHLHPEVVRHAGSLLESGNHFHAVFEAAKAYDKAVAMAAGSTKHGSDLMHEAFGNRRLVKVTPCSNATDLNIQDGTMFLSVGLMRVVRNPTAHEPALDWPMSLRDASDLLGLISFLFRQLDKATGEPTDPTVGGQPK